MLDSNLASLYQRVCLGPLLRIPILKKISPSLFTLFGLLTGLSIPLLLLFHHPIYAFIALFFTGFFDTLDGFFARYHNKTSNIGAVFDIISDRAVEFSIVLGLYLYDPLHRALPSLLMLGSILLCITSFLVIGIFTQNQSQKSFHYSPGLMERSEAFIFFAAMILFPPLFLPLSYLFTSLVLLSALLHLRNWYNTLS